MELADAAPVSQLTFEGLDVSSLGINVKSHSEPLAKAMSIGDEGEARITYEVIGVRHVRNKDGVLLREHEAKIIRFLSEA